MSTEIKNKIVPKLRFPEFQKQEGWAKKEFNELFEIGNGKDYKHLSKGDIPVYGSGGYMLSVDDYLYDGESVCIGRKGTIDKPIFLSGKFWVVDTLFYTNSFKDCLPKFIYSIFQNINWRSHNEAGGVPSLTKTTINKIEVYIPKPKEQQKIADCLSSLDELITAHNQKLEALQSHKKGLMQQLFPAEGETVPKLRFEEFRDSGEWVEKSIQQLIDDKIIISHLDGNHGELYPRAEEFSHEGIPYITANDFFDGLVDFKNCKYLPETRAKQFKKGVAKDGDILFAHNATVGPVAKLKTDYPFVVLSTTATYFRCDNKSLSNDFLKFALSSSEFVRQYTRVMSQSTRNQVPITTQRKFNLHLPKIAEQQKIADCLSSLDELITAQTEKIEALQKHKKGLMQGLFPQVNN